MGPERIEPEWWRLTSDLPCLRDHHRIVEAAGRIRSLYREGRYNDLQPPGRFVQGMLE